MSLWPRQRPPGFRLLFALVLSLFLPLVALSLGSAGGQKAAQERLRPEGIDGSLVICGGGKLPDSVLTRFVQLAGGEQAHLVIVPTASDRADKEAEEKLLAPWKARKVASVTLLHTRSKQTANDPKFCSPLQKATGVWFGGGSQGRIADAYVGTAVEKELYALLKRGGVIGGSSAGAAVMSRLMIASGNPDAKTAQGFDLLPAAVVDQHFLKRNRQPRLLAVLEKNPGLVGFGIDEGTALILRGRQLQVLGDSTVTVCLAKSATRATRTFELKPGTPADLTTLRRTAIARAEAPFSPKVAPVPNVPKGSLVIVGGGGMPANVTQKFIELAGGPDALIVVLPIAASDGPPKATEGNFFKKAGARNVHTLTARTLKEIEDPKTIELVKKANALWFGGGRQWRFVDAYEGTKAYDLLHDILRRGGVIGGSSAGATIQGDYLCRGSPLGNLEMMCEGYERGFAFLPGVAIDQHFAQRKRFRDMTALIKVYPQLLGIGIDEATALIVKGHVADVMGRSQVHFYDARSRAEGAPEYVSVGAGGRYDLKTRQALAPAKAK
ncbi:MAG TPA: cyanophycinase [Gemmataceae bacterium]|nr:cyanophycinase [Gemmataceae bacterium]